jgi:hypothetical protein
VSGRDFLLAGIGYLVGTVQTVVVLWSVVVLVIRLRRPHWGETWEPELRDQGKENAGD